MEKKAMKCIPLHDHRLKLKSVFLDHLHTVYYCKKNVIDFLQQVEGRTGLMALRQLIGSYKLIEQKQVYDLNRLYEHLEIQPEEIFVTGFKAYSLEALIAVLKQHKDAYKSELTIITHLHGIGAIDLSNTRLLHQMAISLNVYEVNLLSMIVCNKVILNKLKHITESII